MWVGSGSVYRQNLGVVSGSKLFNSDPQHCTQLKKRADVKLAEHSSICSVVMQKVKIKKLKKTLHEVRGIDFL